MTLFNSKFIAFAHEVYSKQASDIQKWEKSSDPTLSQLCKDIIEVVGES